VAEALALKLGELASLIGVAPRTMARRKRAKVLSAIESDRLVAIARIAAHAEETLGSRKAAQGWLRHPILALGNAAPIEYLDTEPGRRKVEDVLYQIDYGMY
jgi:putative toxin-antitoxin system antitoxin component (TIGR02293 family)